MNAKTSFAIGVAYGHCRTWLENFSQEHEIPIEILTSRLAELLGDLGQRPSNSMPRLQRKATGSSDLRKSKMEMVKRSSRKPQEKVTCPECSKPFGATGMHKHLVHGHGYSISKASEYLKGRKKGSIIY